ncbi:hypothetical protein N7403_30795, partial [Pseudomonas nitroreducens]|uniref:hypothetical protein n=1 Tax=Pseudomonas nitroreducens TaxID=46680 RepID=UPI0024467FE2
MQRAGPWREAGLTPAPERFAPLLAAHFGSPVPTWEVGQVSRIAGLRMEFSLDVNRKGVKKGD